MRPNRGLTPAQLRWLALANLIITSVIAGPFYCAVGRLCRRAGLPVHRAGLQALVDSLVVPGHASTPGYHDPQYPFYGRPVPG
ncbi:MAG: hypothetical protein R3E68_04650 [Burkholderiaceae bacterium]